MPAYVIRCLRPDIKKELVKLTGVTGIHTLPDCEDGSAVQVTKVRSGKGGEGGIKRAPSEYNIFMGTCVKGKSGDITNRFKSCVLEWKARKSR